MSDSKTGMERVTAVTTYRLEMRDGQCSESVEFDHEPDAAECEEACEEWVSGGDWGSDGASISVGWTVTAHREGDEDDEEVTSGHHTVEVKPDHDSLIRAAGGDPECDHDWTSEGEGGCSESPGVWSHGGTSMSFASHCRLCGLHRREYHTGSQRNPGEHDTVSYEQPAFWCAECQCEECGCEPEGDE